MYVGRTVRFWAIQNASEKHPGGTVNQQQGQHQIDHMTMPAEKRLEQMPRQRPDQISHTANHRQKDADRRYPKNILCIG